VLLFYGPNENRWAQPNELLTTFRISNYNQLIIKFGETHIKLIKEKVSQAKKIRNILIFKKRSLACGINSTALAGF
jgi:hypothetical protein